MMKAGTEIRSKTQCPIFKWPVLQVVAAVAFCLIASNASAQTGYQDGFSQSVLMGHSFFRPACDDIVVLAPYTGHTRHTQYKQIAGGINGDVGSHWRDTGENEGAKAEIKLGNTELLGFTVTGDAPDNEFEDFAAWIDLALQYGPDRLDTVFIHSVWTSATTYPTYASNRAQQDQTNAAVNDMVQQLRDAYPDLTILTVPVGEAMIRLWQLYDQGQLGPEIWGVKMQDGRENYLQWDDTGHAGDIMEDTMGLIWHQTLYPEYDIRTMPLNPPTYQQSWTYDIRQLAYEIWNDESYAHRYQDVFTDIPAAGGLGLALGAGLLALGGAVTIIRRRQ